MSKSKVNSDNEIIKIAEQFINHTNRHLFLTGRAGTGKTTFLKKIVASTHKNTIVAAPTGIAAINAGGVTLHSLFQLPFGSFIPKNVSFNESVDIQLNTPQSIVRNFQMNRTKREMIRAMELLIIDEVSMLRADLLDAIDVVLKMVRKRRNVPFGGVQILFIGDLLQLPPVVKDEEYPYLNPYYKSLHFFHAQALIGFQPLYIELEKIYRQTDQQFITVLNRLRDNEARAEDIALLNERFDPEISNNSKSSDGYVHITTHNRIADNHNKNALAKLSGRSYFFESEVEGDFSEYQYPLDPKMELKLGAQVMFIKNDYSGEGLYFNGKIGKVRELTNDSILVEFDDGSNDAYVTPYEWENKRYTLNKVSGEIEEKVIGRFKHYPIKLAWAITVHKSQGLTFEKAVIDVSRAFAPGQIYVALSRLTSLQGLKLNAKIPMNKFIKDNDVDSFSKQKKEQDQLMLMLKDETVNFLYDNALNAFDFTYMQNSVAYHLESYNKEENRSKKQNYKSWAVKLKEDVNPVKDVADNFLKKIQWYKRTERENLGVLLERTEAARKYFTPLLNDFSKRCNQQIILLASERGIKKYTNELRDLEIMFFRQLQLIEKSNMLVHAVIDDHVLTKKDLRETELVKNRKVEIKLPKPKARKTAKEKVKKEPKVKSHIVTYELLQAGKTLEEVAAERGLVYSTIFSHVVKLVGEGKCNAADYISADKVEKIITVANSLEEIKTTEIKAKLGDEFSYEDIRLAMMVDKMRE